MNELSWKITSLEKRRRFEKVILIVLPMLIVFIFSSMLGDRDISMRELIYGLLISIVSIPVFFLINRVLPYGDFTYFLSDNKIVISRGKEKKEYSWNDFEYFFSSLRAKQSALLKILSESKRLMGDQYFLKKKKKTFLSKLYKTFVIIQSEPNNDKEILSFLSRHLPKRERRASDDVGLIFYKFKGRGLEISLVLFVLILIILLVLFVRSSSPKIGPSDTEMKDLRIMLAMDKIKVKTPSIFFSERHSFALLSCDYDQEMIEFCNDIEKETGVKPTIYSSKEDYCAYIKLTRTFGEKKNYYCIDNGNMGFTFDPAQSGGGGCDGITFTCPDIRKRTQLFY